MNTRKILSSLEIAPSKEEMSALKKTAKDFVLVLQNSLKKQKIKADVFVGGSFAKNTLVKKEIYDIDVFVRFDWKYDSLTNYLQKALSSIKGYAIQQVHGSRNYFQARKNNVLFEIIPVTKIKHPKEARNVTDLSYFHVNYVKRKINTRLANEIRLAKTFCHAQKVYGAESYIQGFSGYALECLIIHFKTFEKMLKALSSVKGRLIIDIEKHYKNQDSIFIELNESKLNSPIILIDPTWKERNALAALSIETFTKFQKSAKAFLKKPSPSFFIDKPISTNKLKAQAKAKKAEFLAVKITTNMQSGDIAGTKLKKFSKFLQNQLSTYYKILKEEFEYNKKQSAFLYLIVKSKKEIIKIGPPLKLKENVKAFKKQHQSTFEKNSFIHARIKIKESAKQFLDSWKAGNSKLLDEMKIIDLEVN